MAPWALTAAEMRRRLDSGETTAVELACEHIARIEAVDPGLGAFVTVTAERAIADAEAAQARIAEGRAEALTGIPVAIKDNIATLGVGTTCASRILAGYVPPFESTAAARLREAGAVLLGKTNLDEFAMGSSTEFSAFHPTRNPWDPSRVPGGSSGGSAASVAAGLAPMALGSDTGGSVRQPAAMCGVVGFKPTYGRVSRYGLVAFSSSLDQIGPLARTVSDAATAFEAVFGADGRDATCVDRPYDPGAARDGDLRGRRVGALREMLSPEVDKDVSRVVREAAEKMAQAGAEVEEFSAPMVEHGVSTYYIIAPAEASSNLARYDGVRYGLRVEADTHIGVATETRSQGFGREVKERIIIGTYVLSSGYYEAYYAKAQQARAAMSAQFREAFRRYDALLAPTSPTTAFLVGELADDPIALKLADYCTIPASMGGFPAISINAGFAAGLPVGLQLIADGFRDDALLGLALGAEAAIGLEPAIAEPGTPQ